MLFCPSSSPLDVEDACVRVAWSALVPFALVLLFLLRVVTIRVFSNLFSFSSPLDEFLTLEEAEALDYDDSKPRESVTNDSVKKRPPQWFSALLTIAGLVQTGSWLAVAAYLFATTDRDIRSGVLAILFALSWLYASLKAALKPTAGPPYDLFALYLIHLLGASLMLGGVMYDHKVYMDPMPPRVILGGLIANLVVVFGLVALVLSRPLAVPSESSLSEGKNISPEDFTTLFGWVWFSWVTPLIAKGTNETLQEKDVWDLSVTMQARPVFRKFLTLDQKRGLLWKIWAANSKDMMCVYYLS